MNRYTYHPGERAHTPRSEALARRNDQDGLNRQEDAEYAYSALTGAVGIRFEDGAPFRVFNVHYPMCGRSESVADWVSVGISRAIGERGARRYHAIA